jgi:glycine dehydrogenase subunit 1
MCEALGVASPAELFDEIPESLRPKSFDLPEPMSEMEVVRRMEELAGANRTDFTSFLGAGYYDHHIPPAIDALASRGEFFTAYTPYQPEASQGTLQAIFEYQSLMAGLMGMHGANASVYDGGSALFEAMMMAVRSTKRIRVVIGQSVNPIYRIMLASYSRNLNLELVTLPHRNGQPDYEGLTKAVDDRTAAIVVQNPTFFGGVTDYTELIEHAHSKGALAVMSTYPLLQSVLKTPGAMGADIAVAEGQSFGLPLSFGGPYLGVMACTKKLVRQLPGRIAGRTVDTEGRDGYVLTLQAREQHIRRQKATSNICSNQALCALRAVIYASLLGPEGLRRTAGQCIEKAHYAAERLTAIDGVEMYTAGSFGNEFAVTLPCDAYGLSRALVRRGFVPGFPVGRYYPGLEDVLLVAVTEKHTREQIGIMTELVSGAVHGC